jgi:hypothetical protein
MATKRKSDRLRSRPKRVSPDFLLQTSHLGDMAHLLIFILLHHKGVLHEAAQTGSQTPARLTVQRYGGCLEDRQYPPSRKDSGRALCLRRLRSRDSRATRFRR